MVPAKVAGGVTYNHNMFIVEATGYINLGNGDNAWFDIEFDDRC